MEKYGFPLTFVDGLGNIAIIYVNDSGEIVYTGINADKVLEQHRCGYYKCGS